MSELKTILLLDVCEPLSEDQIYFINSAVGHRTLAAFIPNHNFAHTEVSKINLTKREFSSGVTDYLEYNGPSPCAGPIGESTFVSMLLYFREYLQKHPEDIFKVRVFQIFKFI